MDSLREEVPGGLDWSQSTLDLVLGKFLALDLVPIDLEGLAGVNTLWEGVPGVFDWSQSPLDLVPAMSWAKRVVEVPTETLSPRLHSTWLLTHGRTVLVVAGSVDLAGDEVQLTDFNIGRSTLST